MGGGRLRVRKRRSSHPDRPLNRQCKRGAPTPLLVSPLKGGRDEFSLGRRCCAFPNSHLRPPSRGEVRWGVGRCEPPPAVFRPPPQRHSCAPFPSFLRRQEPRAPRHPSTPDAQRQRKPPPAGRPHSCLRRNDASRRAPIVLPYPPTERKCDAMPNSPGAPNKPEQTRTNPNTAGRLDQIGKPPATPPNTVKKTTLNITRERSQPPTPPLRGGRDELGESVVAGLGAEHREPATVAHTGRPRTNLNKPEQIRTPPNTPTR